MTTPARTARIASAVVIAIAGVTLFQLFGNANRGYIATDSLFYWWTFQWWNADSETQHGWLVLAIAVWLAARNVRGQNSEEFRAHSLEQDTGRSALGCQLSALDRSAVAALVAALALHAIGFAAQQARVSIIALLLFLWGVLRLGGGRRWSAAAAFPLAFMVFAIPLNALDSVGFWLRLWVIRASTAIAHAAGIAVLQNGTQLMSPDGRYNYDVAAACSGIRSLMALAALSLLIGYLNFRGWWRRGLMLLLCFPLVFVGNVARITAIIFAAQLGGSKWGDIAHEVMGYAIFAIVLGGVLGAARLLERRWPEPAERGLGSAPPAQAEGALPPPAPDPDAREVRPYVIAFFVLAVCFGEGVFLYHLATMPPRGLVGVVLSADDRNPVELPSFLGRDWIGTPVPVSEAEREILPPDRGFSKIRYTSPGGAPPVFLSIVLSGRDRTSIHRPELCLVGQGWTITGGTTYRFTAPEDHATFPATVLHVEREVRVAQKTKRIPQLVAYWFIGGDTVVATQWGRLALDAWNRVVHARADRWAYVLMQTDATDGEAAALARMQAMLNLTLPRFQRATAR